MSVSVAMKHAPGSRLAGIVTVLRWRCSFSGALFGLESLRKAVCDNL